MSAFLSVACDWVHQPAATDELELRTWCMLGIRVAGRTVTRVWDRAMQQERAHVYVPAFPIAEWIVLNWWALLNEPCRTPVIPRTANGDMPWIKRHCLRCADSALLLPALYFYNDGRGIGVEWQADQRDNLPHLPGEFVDGNCDRLDKDLTESALAEFVNAVLAQVKGLAEERVQATLATWHAIQNADIDETRFCIAAGRLGLDPYDPSQVTDDLADFLETGLGDPEELLVRDLTEVADARTIAAQWNWVQEASRAQQLGPGPTSNAIGQPAAKDSPFRFGYELAARVREAAGLAPTQAIGSVHEVGQLVTNSLLETPDQNHIPGQELHAIVGWNPRRRIVIAGPRLPRHDNQRFLDARGLYHALFTCESSHRLVTRAYTWDQQSSRAFAAELLAPREALRDRAPKSADSAAVERLAREFVVSTRLIENQLENAGVTVVDE
ncbi:MAG: hypothetical protein J5I93_05530 [Pirellulaceae bacterium]|nr:hypothetical protein [Pirellulaceae bacterium]